MNEGLEARLALGDFGGIVTKIIIFRLLQLNSALKAFETYDFVSNTEM